MKAFYDEYDAIDPKDGNVMPRGLVESLVKFYEEKYNGDEWQKYGDSTRVMGTRRTRKTQIRGKSTAHKNPIKGFRRISGPLSR
jgi:hypothetical protein